MTLNVNLLCGGWVGQRGCLAYSGLVFAEFFIATFIAPSLPAADILATPTLDLLLPPRQGHLSPEQRHRPCLSPVTQSVPSGMSGCIPDQIMITAPEPGEVVHGTVEINGHCKCTKFWIL